MKFWIRSRRIEAGAATLQKRRGLRIIDQGREALPARELPADVGLNQRGLGRRPVKLFPRDEQREREDAGEHSTESDPTRACADLQPVDEFLARLHGRVDD